MPLPPELTPEQTAELLAGQAAAIARRRVRSAPPLTRVLAAPCVVPLGGVPTRLGELTLSDLAALQQWVADRSPHPLDGLPPAGLDDEPETRRERLKAAWEAARTWPPRFASPEARALTTSPTGLLELLRLCLRRADPGATEADALEVAGRMVAADWATVHRVAFGVDPWREILLEVEPEPESPPVNWVEAILEVVERTGWTLPQVGELTVSQWRAIRGGVEAFAYKFTPRPGESLRETRDREARMFDDE